MITLDIEKCTRCGACARYCHEGCITLSGDGPVIDVSTCSTCTQCIAACPNQALGWDGAVAEAFQPERLPTPAQLDELFKQRRSIRKFKPQKIERELLEEIASYGIYAPTHNFHLRAILIDDDALIEMLDQAVLDNCRWIFRMGYQFKFLELLANLFGYGDEMRLARPKVEATLARGRSFISMPTAFILIIGDKKTPLSLDSAQYALANMIYYAQIKGIGACLWGNAPIFIDKLRSVRRRLGIRPDERIYGGLYMGYPAVRFHNKVNGKTMPIQWNGDSRPLPVN